MTVSHKRIISNYKVLSSIIIGIMILLFSSAFSYRIVSLLFGIIDSGFLYSVAYYFVNLISVFICIFLWKRFVLCCTWKDIFLGNPLPNRKWILIAIIIPIIIICFYFLFVPGSFKIGSIDSGAVFQRTVGTVIDVCFVYSVIFGGMILSRLISVLKWQTAVISSALIYTGYIVFHNVGFNIEGRLLFLVMLGSFIEGVSMALVTVSTGSIWSSLVILGIYNIVIADGAVINISLEEPYESMFAYILEPGNVFIVGTEMLNTVEVALPSMIGFAVIAFIALYLIRKERRALKSDV